MSALVKKLGSLGLEIASGLTRVSADSSQIFIETPLLYPSGTHVIVCIDAGGGAHFVSDNGGGFREADLMGTSRSFSGIANRVAELTHLDFDSNNFYASGVSRENLLTAVIAIANASKLATDQTSFKLATKPYQFDDEQLVERLDSIFGTAHVAPLQRGASTAETFSTIRVFGTSLSRVATMRGFGNGARVKAENPFAPPMAPT